MSDQSSIQSTKPPKRYIGCLLIIIGLLSLVAIPFLFLFAMAFYMATGSSPQTPADGNFDSFMAMSSLIGLILSPIIAVVAGIWGGALWFRNAPEKS